MKKTVLMLLLLIVALAVQAVPAKRMKHTLTLADGTKVEATLVGDEHGHWFVDAEGRQLVLDNEVGRYLTAEEFSSLKANAKARFVKNNARRVNRTFGEPTVIKGDKKGIVILVNYTDKKFKSTHNQALFNDRFNKEGYTNSEGYVGSVHDYFYDQSYGQFNLTFDVVGPVTVSKTCSYYGSNDSDGNDKYPAEMVIEALKLVDDQVDFKDYDWDGDGEVDQVFVIYAGEGEAAGGASTTIWPHEYELSSAAQYGDGTGAQTLDGVKIDTYAVSCELASSSVIDGIGTACHEFSHCLGYADLYDTDYSGGQGMMNWGLMDGGSYNGPDDHGEVPAPYTSFEREWAGWMKYTELTEPCQVNGMKPITSEPEAYVVYNQKNRNEYYLFENHQGEKWDAYTGGHGMLILHVDYDKSVWQENAPNDNPNRQRMTFIPADNSYGTKQSYGGGQYAWSESYEQSAGDPWPGTKKKTAFTDTTTPAATLYSANTDGRKYLGKPIENIEESEDGLISFTFDGGISLAVPQPEEATEITDCGFTAHWTEVSEAESYNLEVVEIAAGSSEPTELLTEDFSKITATADGTSDEGSKLDDHTLQPGWTGSSVYLSTSSLKLGSSKKTGYVATPLLKATTDGSVTVKAVLQSFGNDASSASLSLVDGSNGEIWSKTFALTGDSEDYEFSIEGVKKDFKVKFANTQNKKRFYLQGLTVVGGADKTTEHKFEGITATEYAVDNLSGGNCKFRVQAVNADAKSAWSDYKEVVTPTGISVVGSQLPANADGCYSLTGQKVGNPQPGTIYIKNGHKYICE